MTGLRLHHSLGDSQQAGAVGWLLLAQWKCHLEALVGCHGELRTVIAADEALVRMCVLGLVVVVPHL